MMDWGVHLSALFIRITKSLLLPTKRNEHEGEKIVFNVSKSKK